MGKVLNAYQEHGVLIRWLIVATNDKRPFFFSEDGRKIRTNQGYSIAVDLKMRPVTPPARLSHGTAWRFLQSIHKVKGKRRYMHLTGSRYRLQG